MKLNGIYLVMLHCIKMAKLIFNKVVWICFVNDIDFQNSGHGLCRQDNVSLRWLNSKNTLISFIPIKNISRLSRGSESRKIILNCSSYLVF